MHPDIVERLARIAPRGPQQLEFDFRKNPQQLALPGCKPPAYVRVGDRAPVEPVAS